MIEFTVTNRKGQEFQCFIDDEDADLLSGKRYVITTNKGKPSEKAYLLVKRNGKSEFIHRLILGRIVGHTLVKSEEADHIDRNPLNNTRDNLRVCDHSQNSANRKARTDSKLGIKGVYQHKKFPDRYYARIYVKGKRFHLGGFATPEEASTAYLDAAKKYYGEFATSE